MNTPARGARARLHAVSAVAACFVQASSRFFTAGFALLAVLLFAESSFALPSFARKYGTSCQTCHTVYPVLNPFGEAFRRNGYRFPSQNGSLDSDSVKEPAIEMGQEEYEKLFPYSVWPDKIPASVPLSAQLVGTTSYRIPGSAARNANGNNFTWNGLLGSATLYAGGAFSDSLTYFSKVTLTEAGTSLDAGYLLWNDLVGPAHVVNLWVGRLANPQLTSYSLRGTYLRFSLLPPVSVAALLNSNGSFVLGAGPNDGVEVSGVALHRISYSAGWVASSAQSGLNTPNSEDFYGHVGWKLGGMSLDGEGPSGMDTANSQKPWAELSATLDGYFYHDVSVLDNGTGVAGAAVRQRTAVDTLGVALHTNIDSFVFDGGFEYQRHYKPYAGTASSGSVPGVADNTRAKGYLGYGELEYVVFPWLVPGVRAEYTFLESDYGNGSLLRIYPGAAVLLRPNIKLIVTGDLQRVYRRPPVATGTTSDWTAAGSLIVPNPGAKAKFEAEQISASLSWSF